MNSALQKVIRKVGSTTKLGRALGITRQAVECWKAVPAERVLAVEKLTGISRHELRPDVFGPAPRKTRAA